MALCLALCVNLEPFAQRDDLRRVSGVVVVVVVVAFIIRELNLDVRVRVVVISRLHRLF